MFKQLSQLGKNISDEISKGLSDDLNSSVEQFVDDNSGLPKEVQTKLRKFEKYEQKYPLLLQAYKNEKIKSEKFQDVEKVLMENTPISSIDDLDSLPSFFKNINDKTAMLNDEIKKLSALQSNNTSTKDASLNAEVSHEKHHTGSDALQNQIDKLTEELEDLKKECEEHKTTVKTQRDQTSKLTKDLEEKDTIIENQKTELYEKSKKEDKLTSELKENNIKIASYEESIKSKDMEINGLKRKLSDLENTENTKNNDNVSSPLNTEQASISNVNESNSTNGKKKKNKKNKKKPANQKEEYTSFVAEEKSAPGSKDMDNEEYKSLLKEFNDFKEGHKQCEDIKLKFEELKSENDKIQSETLPNLKKEHLSLQDELTKTKANLKGKTDEVEEVREMLRDVGNELVEAKDELKKLQENNAGDSNTLRAELDEVHKEKEVLLKDFKNKEDELEASIKKYQDDITDLKKNISKLNEQRTAHEQAISQSNVTITKLKNDNNVLNVQLKELAVLKKSENQLKTNLVQKEKTITYLENQIKKYTEDEKSTKTLFDSLKKENEQLKVSSDNLIKQNNELKTSVTNSSASFENYIKENGKLSERLSVLQEKYDSIQSLKSNSNDQVELIQRQCEELTFKLKEATKKNNINLEDEINEYANIIQDKTREAATMRRLLSDAQNNEESKFVDIKHKLERVLEEKNKIQSDMELQDSRTSREIQNWKKASDELNTEIHALRLREKQLLSEIETINALNKDIKIQHDHQSNDSGELERVTSNLKESLLKSDKKVRDLQESNDELMSLNNDLNKKLDRITKNYRTISNQLSTLKEEKVGESNRTSRSNSSVSVSALNNNPPKANVNVLTTVPSSVEKESELNEKLAYLKNVLLGFLEHKDQRNQLLPVISMLLKLDSSDERRLVTSLK
ncbi:hypothetical protein TPHA_0K01990 [Tetrapisispora phaffii CBS 4417]|uniref:GRIP domain-containing protein n=1 Tax=Tetrapisispora phaffii (strain ATCC 24235 / CBS 4417 / NBRC 1672 / NRRL Y-8282 / UCD 70-5) TaxID=1071381 RepID=G8BZK4_TETPH|nr:hypothetical protein TPHA_0K01990 [Tetrapisispora phaffii CBS 4417]CCE65332.1 hypothetical protein TPHA_0K01990 [Tetrapisispora phaffii CBS 4417]